MIPCNCQSGRTKCEMLADEGLTLAIFSGENSGGKSFIVGIIGACF